MFQAPIERTALKEEWLLEMHDLRSYDQDGGVHDDTAMS